MQFSKACARAAVAQASHHHALKMSSKHLMKTATYEKWHWMRVLGFIFSSLEGNSLRLHRSKPLAKNQVLATSPSSEGMWQAHRCSRVPTAPGPHGHAVARALLSQRLHWQGSASCLPVQSTKGPAHLNKQADTSAHHRHSSCLLVFQQLKRPIWARAGKVFLPRPCSSRSI